MRLNPDCIRDILLYIESKTDSQIGFVNFEELVNDLNTYDENTLHYHVDQVLSYGLVHDVKYAGPIQNLLLLKLVQFL